MQAAGAFPVGFIGLGTLARQLVSARPTTQWVALVRPDFAASVPETVRIVHSADDLIAAAPCVVIEVAGPVAVGEIVPVVLAAGIPVIMASIGALNDAALASDLRRIAQSSGTRLILPAGAIGGLDYIEAVAKLPGTRITYTSRKPFSAWVDQLSPAVLASRQAQHLLFEGSASDAAPRYPKNLNVAMALALAAAPTEIFVRIIADRTVTHNTHEIEVASPAGTATMRFANKPLPDNPKTSWLTALSLDAALTRILGEKG